MSRTNCVLLLGAGLIILPSLGAVLPAESPPESVVSEAEARQIVAEAEAKFLELTRGEPATQPATRPAAKAAGQAGNGEQVAEQGVPVWGTLRQHSGSFTDGFAEYELDEFLPTTCDDPTVMFDAGYIGERGTHVRPPPLGELTLVHIPIGAAPTVDPRHVDNPRLSPLMEEFRAALTRNPSVRFSLKSPDGTSALRWFRIEADGSKKAVTENEPMLSHPYVITCADSLHGYTAIVRVSWQGSLDLAPRTALPHRAEWMIYHTSPHSN